MSILNTGISKNQGYLVWAQTRAIPHIKSQNRTPKLLKTPMLTEDHAGQGHLCSMLSASNPVLAASGHAGNWEAYGDCVDSL